MRGVNQNILKAYLFGALHDGTFNRKHKTWRISQSNVQWLERLKTIFTQLGYRAWIYREGKFRTVSVIETGADFLNVKTEPNQLASVQEQMLISEDILTLKEVFQDLMDTGCIFSSHRKTGKNLSKSR